MNSWTPPTDVQFSIGTRLALGAGRCDIIRMILREAGVLVGLGVGAGTVLALVAGRATASMLFNLHPHDPATLVMAVGMLTAVALAASLIPALRAARMDPMAALRYE